jgi:hypothetical protein
MGKSDLVKNLLPPIFYKGLAIIKNIITNYNGDRLFDGDDRLFKKIIANANIYVEYGSGASTIWVANNTNCDIYSIDSSSVWLDKVREKVGARSGLNLHFSNIGKTQRWGFPVNYEQCDNFIDYTDWVWSRASPDVVLVDGRFRVCCFLVSLINAKPGTYIIFDDYADREFYHYVERYLKPIEYCGRQALFINSRWGRFRQGFNC